MTEQLVLAPSHRDDGEESRTAASKVKAEKQFWQVLGCLYDAISALTDDQIAERCGLLRHAAGTRRGVAVRRGFVERAGRSVSALGNPASSWRLTDAGQRAVEQMREGRAA